MVWYSHLFKNFPQFVVIHTVKGFSVVSEADTFLEFPCFLHDPTNYGNVISGSSFLNPACTHICKFSVHIPLKPTLKDFEHYLASMWNQLNCTVVLNFLWHCPFLSNKDQIPKIEMKTRLFQSCGHCLVFLICWCIECSTLIAPSFRIWNSSAGIPSPPLV